MKHENGERGSVLVWMTLMIVLILVMVGMGLDTGQLVYTRATTQSAVDAAALAAASGIPQSEAEARARATAFNGVNNYTNSNNIPIQTTNVTFLEYHPDQTPDLVPAASFTTATAARVALETKNPYDAGATNTPIVSPVFLTPLLKLMGANASGTQNVSVSAVAVISAIPSIPIAVFSSVCNGENPVPDVLLRRQPEPPTGPENSCWTTYLDPSPGANDVRDLFTATRTCTGGGNGVSLGTTIRLAPGEQGSSLGAADDLFMKAEPGKCWMIPVIDASTDCNGWGPIKDWAKICPTDVQKTSNPKYIKATVTCGQSLIRNSESLCFAHRLVRDKPSGY